MDRPAVRPHYRAVFISPHLDDAVFSCGATIDRLVKEGTGPVLVLNLFSRYLSEVKIRGVVLGDERYQEEANAAQFLGFESRNLGELDVSFRREPYKKLGNIFRPPVADDLAWLPTLREKVFALLSEMDYDQLYVPLGIGWHVDHVLTYQLFEPWANRPNLFFYEDAPYCCIPHSTRYRLNELATYPREASDQTLAPIDENLAWREASSAYAETALMKNIRPWIVRKIAVPVVSFYLHRLMAFHRKVSTSSQKKTLMPVIVPISLQLDRKVDAMTLYPSQFDEFFLSRQDCVKTLSSYAQNAQGREAKAEVSERFWVIRSRAI